LGIEFRYLPTACPELNPVEGLWRYAKARLLANRTTTDIEESVARVCDELEDMSGPQRLRTAGILSQNFWLAT
jgi:transposase